MHLLFSLQGKRELRGHYRVLFRLVWWFLRSLQSLNYSLWNVLFGRAELFLTERTGGFKIPFLGYRIKYSSNLASQPPSAYLQKLAIKSGKFYFALTMTTTGSAHATAKTMGFCYEFYIPSPFFQGATRLCVCIENNRWSFLLSQVPELGRGRAEETWTRIHWTRWYRMEPIRFHRVPRALHPMSFLTNEENVGSVEDVFFKAGWANMFKIRELVGNSLWIDSIYTLETVAFSAGEE